MRPARAACAVCAVQVGESCDSAVIARFDLDPVVLHYQPMYWALGHFSRFLPRHSQRVHYQLSNATTLQLTTWVKRDGAGQEVVVVVVMNDGDSELPLAVQAGVRYAELIVPAHSMHSLTFPANLHTASEILARD